MNQYIYRTRCLQKTLSTQELKSIIKDNYNIQKYVCIVQDKENREKLFSRWKKMGQANRNNTHPLTVRVNLFIELNEGFSGFQHTAFSNSFIT